MSHDHTASAHGAGEVIHKPHVLGLRIYFAVWGALLVLTVLTVYVSYFNFGEWNLGIAMIVASAKAALVAMFFMHLKYDERFNLIVFLSSLAFLSLLFILTMADFETRGDVDPLEKGTIQVLPAAPGTEAPAGEAVPAQPGSTGTSPEAVPDAGGH
jgi:cytochrome c oxidase subunit 4